jgi:predicted kinase
VTRCPGCGNPGPPSICRPCTTRQLNPGEVVLVTGAPASGKTTYVYENAEPGDVIVDLDRLSEALGSPRDHDHDQHITSLALAAWDGVLARLKSGRHECPKVWVVRCAAKPAERTELARSLGVTKTIVMDTPPDEAKARAQAAGRPERYAALIDDWWVDNPPS